MIRYTLILLVVLTAYFKSFSQNSEKVVSRNYRTRMGKQENLQIKTQRKKINPPNISRLLEEDKLNEQMGGGPLRFGDRMPVNYTLENSGE